MVNMLISTWNIRGMNHPSKEEAVVRYLRRNNIAIMALLETRIRDVNASSLESFRSSWSIDSNLGMANNI